jgi:hypothetical protein
MSKCLEESVHGTDEWFGAGGSLCLPVSCMVETHCVLYSPVFSCCIVSPHVLLSSKCNHCWCNRSAAYWPHIQHTASRGSTECLQSRVDTIAPTHGCLAAAVWSEPKTKTHPACAHEANAARLRQRSVALASSCQVLLDALPARITSSVLGCCDHFPSFAISASKCSNYIDISGDSSGFC